ncbi:MAG: tetratricopeptide repeat protein [Chloroflexi bacterium]|nr:tetratricopeptide repeat protein [Chloroflexota bacterium]
MTVQTTTCCSTCNFAENPPSARFCGNCASPLPLHCFSCGAANPPGFRFCGTCATGLIEYIPAATTRRVVTILFADVCNYTNLTNRLGAEHMYSLLDPCLRRLGETVRRFEGTIDKFTGDGLMAVFGMPVALEAHAAQAAYAALAMFEELAAYNETIAQAGVQFQIRVGLASGEVIAGLLGSDRYSDLTVIGGPVNLAARLQQVTDPGTIMVDGDSAQSLQTNFMFNEQHPVALKGFEQPIAAAILAGKQLAQAVVDGSFGLPLIGREAELQNLIGATELLHNGMGGVIGLTGRAGVGKTRLTAEIIQHLHSREVKVLTNDCSSATRIVPYSAFLGLIRQLFQIDHADSAATIHHKIQLMIHSLGNMPLDLLPYIEYLLSLDFIDQSLVERVQHLDAAQLKRHVFLAIRELLVACTRQQSMAIVIDDVQWADDLSLELLEFIAETFDASSLLLYMVARDDETPQIRQTFNRILAQARQRGLVLELNSLSPEAAEALIKQILPQASAVMIDHLVRQADGVPFYLEELARHALHAGLDIQAQSSDSLQMPSMPLSLQALMRSRYDRLPNDLAHSLALAAVIGRRFSQQLLCQLRPEQSINQQLQQLQQRGFVQPIANHHDDWAFSHLLLQETIYSSLLQQQRYSLHGEVALALETHDEQRPELYIDALAYHFSRSQLTHKALEYLLLAAQRAASRFANDDALRLYDQAMPLLSELDHPATEQAVSLFHGRGDVLSFVGRYDEARMAYQQAISQIQPSSESQATHATILRQLAATYEKQGNYDEAMLHLEQARLVLADGALFDHARIDCDAGWIAFHRGNLTQAERLLNNALTISELNQHHGLQALAANRLAGVYWQRGSLKAAQALVNQSLAVSRYLGDLPAMSRALNNLGVIAMELADWHAAANYYEQSLETTQAIGDLNGQILAINNRSHCMLMLGLLNDALRFSQMALRLARQIGAKLHMATALIQQGTISFYVQDYQRARRYYLQAEQLFRELGHYDPKRVILAEMLGRIGFVEGRRACANRMAARALRLAQQLNEPQSLFRSQALQIYLQAYNGQRRQASEAIDQLLQLSVNNNYLLALGLTIGATIKRLNGDYNIALAHQERADILFEQMNTPAMLREYV